MARLETHGDILELVVGAFGEVSSDLDRIISALAESRVFYQGSRAGWEEKTVDKEGGGEGEVGQGGAVVGQGDWKAPVPEGRFPLFVNTEGVSDGYISSLFWYSLASYSE